MTKRLRDVKNLRFATVLNVRPPGNHDVRCTARRKSKWGSAPFATVACAKTYESCHRNPKGRSPMLPRRSSAAFKEYPSSSSAALKGHHPQQPLRSSRSSHLAVAKGWWSAKSQLSGSILLWSGGGRSSLSTLA